MIHTPPHLSQLQPYTPGQSAESVRKEYGLTDVVKLASNENPFGPSPKALAAAITAMQNVHVYNDGGAALRESLALHHGVPASHICLSNGSDALIHQIMRTFLLPGETALASEGSFVSFGIAVTASGHEAQYAPLGPGYRFDVEALAGSLTPHTKVIYLPNPNNPTGTHIDHDALQWFLEQVPSTTLVVLDEAYTEYAKDLAPETYSDGTLFERGNVIVLRTFSKAFGLAALRVGYAVGHADVVSWLQRTKLPFDPNGPACAAAQAALDDIDHVRKTVEVNTSGVRVLLETLAENGYTASASVANFVFVDLGSHEAARRFHGALLREGIISRPLAGFGLPHCIRISTGLPDQTAHMADVLCRLAPTIVHD
jgi:histidinol-phosphate aminotransferase